MPITEDGDVEEALTTLGVGPAAKELYVDLLRPAARELGPNLVTLAKMVTAILAPLHALAWGVDRARDWLSAALLRRLAKIPKENIQPPPWHIAGQVLLLLPSLIEDAHLRERYADLLAAAMNREEAGRVHPAYVHVLHQLSPQEALLLVFIATSGIALEAVWSNDDLSVWTPSISDQFRACCERARISDPSQSDVYLDNLVRLGVLSWREWSEGLLNQSGATDYGDYDASVTNKTMTLVELTEFGRGFLAVCVKSTAEASA